MILKAMDEVSPMALAAMLGVHCHLPKFGIGRRKGYGDDTGDEVFGLVKQPEVHLLLFLA